MYTTLVKTLFIPTAHARDGFIDNLNAANPLGANSSIVDIINNVFSWLVRFAALLVPIIIIWGAFQILTSGGEAEKWKTGKNAILYSVIGFLIILMAKGIVDVIEDVLSKAAQ